MESSSPIAVYALGGESPLSQIARIREGLAAQPGVVLTDHPAKADLIYANDAGTHEAALCAGLRRPRATVMLNVLDIPEQLIPPAGDYTLDKLHTMLKRLEQADIVTAISPFVQSQLLRYTNSRSHVIWNPIKDVSPAKRLNGDRPYPQFRALMAGRCRDRNKRFDSIGIPALIMAGFEEREVAVVGGEYPGWGTDLGIVSDATLNDLYNSVDFVIQPTALAGLELAPLEGMICGALPIICYDMSTFGDLPYPRHWGCYPSATSVAFRLRMLSDNPVIMEHDRQYAIEAGRGLSETLSKNAVAARIIELYRKMVQSSPSS